jgi:hypothetical protein
MNFKHPLRIFSLALLCLFAAPPLKARQQSQPQGACLPTVALPAPTEPNIFNEEQEVYLGEVFAERIQKDYRIIEDSELTGYLTRIGERLSKHLPLTKLRFRFFLVDLPNANAFVLPGGRIYVARKLVALTRSEDELAGVISHELGHLVARESAIDLTRRLKEVLGVSEVTDRRDIFEKYNQLIENFRRKPEAYKPRDREKGQLIADQIGFYALLSAGYDPNALARFWDRMTETRGKTGSWLSDLFGTTRPEERRLREMLRAASAMPPNCAERREDPRNEAFNNWQSSVVGYAGLGRREALRGMVAKRQLTPPLRTSIEHLRFSPDGRYVLAQDESSINVLTREPFAPLFRIEAPDAKHASFTPDSQNVVFYTDNLRVEYWNVAEERRTDVKELVLLKGCLQTSLSPEGKYLACLTPDFALNLIEVATGQPVVQRKKFILPFPSQERRAWRALVARGSDNSDVGLRMIEMGFSPDGRYFAAGGSGHGTVNRSFTEKTVEAYDMTTLQKVSLSDSVQKFLSGSFAFMSGDRLVGINSQDRKKSALLTFPAGKIISEFPLAGEVDSTTRGDYVLVRPVREYAVGVLDPNTKIISKASKQAALDVYGDVMVAELRNGQLGLYRMEKNELTASAQLPTSSLGPLRVAEMSSDLKWVALSGRERGGVWNTSSGEAAIYVRGFQGAYLSGDGHFFGEFPEFETAERNVAKFNLGNGEVVPGPKIEAAESASRQIGPYLVAVRSAKPDSEEGGFNDYSRNVILELFDARTLQPLWSKPFAKESPQVWVSSHEETVALVWHVTQEAARAEIKTDAALSKRLASMKEKEGDYLLQILDARNGNRIGSLLVETGKGSFRLRSLYAASEWVVVADTLNRVLVYSLKTGEQRGRVFGNHATISAAKGILCVENESGKLAVYDLNTLEKRDELVFSNPIAVARFSDDGERLFVLTSNQTAYVFDASALASPRPAPQSSATKESAPAR